MSSRATQEQQVQIITDYLRAGSSYWQGAGAARHMTPQQTEQWHEHPDTFRMPDGTKLLGWWASKNHAYRFKDDGICYALGHGSGNSSWDFRDGVYYENGTPFDVVSLTDQEFVCRTRGPHPVTVRLNRIGEADASKY